MSVPQHLLSAWRTLGEKYCLSLQDNVNLSYYKNCTQFISGAVIMPGYEFHLTLERSIHNLMDAYDV